MGARWKVLAGLAAIAGVVLMGLLLARPGGKGPGFTPQSPSVEPGEQTNAEPDHPTASPQAGQRPVLPVESNAQPATVIADSRILVTNWEDKLDGILVAEGAPDTKARLMLEMFPRLPEDGQIEVAKHLSNLVSDDQYAPLGQLLSDPHLPPEVLDTLLADVLNRPNSLKLPALLEVARTAQHPKAGEAKEVLGFFLEADYAEDWPKWQEKMQEWLKNNPD